MYCNLRYWKLGNVKIWQVPRMLFKVFFSFATKSSVILQDNLPQSQAGENANNKTMKENWESKNKAYNFQKHLSMFVPIFPLNNHFQGNYIS